MEMVNKNMQTSEIKIMQRSHKIRLVGLIIQHSFHYQCRYIMLRPSIYIYIYTSYKMTDSRRIKSPQNTSGSKETVFKRMLQLFFLLLCYCCLLRIWWCFFVADFLEQCFEWCKTFLIPLAINKKLAFGQCHALAIANCNFDLGTLVLSY